MNCGKRCHGKKTWRECKRHLLNTLSLTHPYLTLTPSRTSVYKGEEKLASEGERVRMNKVFEVGRERVCKYTVCLRCMETTLADHGL